MARSASSVHGIVAASAFGVSVLCIGIAGKIGGHVSSTQLPFLLLSVVAFLTSIIFAVVATATAIGESRRDRALRRRRRV